MKTYFLGIAGAGVSALASILKSQGHEVTGSDEGVFAPISTYLDDIGIKYSDHFDAANVPDGVELAIIGTTAKINPETNPEYIEIIKRGIPHYNFATYLAKATEKRDNLIVAGSFGKSSLTALITHILLNAGRCPGWFIGAIAKNLDRTGNWGSDNEFIMEGDEYVISLDDRRSKFELYTPKDILLSSIVHDHINMFPTMAEYEERFAKLVRNLPSDGYIFAAKKYEPIRRIIKENGKQAQTIYYDLDECDGFYAKDIKTGEVSTFTLVTPQKDEIKLSTHQLGLHNIENAIAAAAYCLTKKLVTPEQLQDGIANFAGVTRRLDKKTTTSTVPVYEGFGSSFEKAHSAIDAIKLHFPNKKCIVIFEPHTFSWRNRDSLHWYDTVFKGVDEVYLLPPPTHGAANHSQSSHEEIFERTQNAGVKTIKINDAKDCLEKIIPALNGDEVILLLSSGPLFGLPSSLPSKLDELFSQTN